jgi:hypothetical protein
MNFLALAVTLGIRSVTASQMPAAVGLHGRFDPSRRTPFVTDRKAAETRMAIWFVTL